MGESLSFPCNEFNIMEPLNRHGDGKKKKKREVGKILFPFLLHVLHLLTKMFAFPEKQTQKFVSEHKVSSGNAELL